MIPFEEDVTKKIGSLEKRVSDLESILKLKPELKNKEISIREFFNSKKPKKGTQKLLAIAFFLEIHESYISFNVKDLKDAFKRCKEKEPSNVSVYINECIRQGYIMAGKEKKENKNTWCLTNTGERFVENNFKREK